MTNSSTDSTKDQAQEVASKYSGVCSMSETAYSMPVIEQNERHDFEEQVLLQCNDLIDAPGQGNTLVGPHHLDNDLFFSETSTLSDGFSLQHHTDPGFQF